jgi:hypothetical protein
MGNVDVLLYEGEKGKVWYLRIHDCPITSVTLVLWTQSQDKGIGTGIQDIGLVTCLLPAIAFVCYNALTSLFCID